MAYLTKLSKSSFVKLVFAWALILSMAITMVPSECLPINSIGGSKLGVSKTEAVDLAPVTITTSTSENATLESFQRKIIYATSNFWALFSDGVNLSIYRSLDGNTWTNAVGLKATENGSTASMWYDSENICIAYASGEFDSALQYRQYTPNDNGTLTALVGHNHFENAQPANVNLSYSYPFVCKDTAGYPVIAYLCDNGTAATPYVTKSNQADGTWTSDNFNTQLSSTNDDSWRACVLPTSTQDLFAIYARDGQPPKSKTYDFSGATWATENTATTDINTGSSFSAVVTSDNVVHLVFAGDTPGNLQYTHYHSSGTAWQAEEALYTGSSGTMAPVLSKTLDDNLYCFWGGDSVANHIYYKAQISGIWDTTRTDWLTESNITDNSSISCSYEMNSANYVPVVWMTGTGPSYNVRFAAVERSQTSSASIDTWLIGWTYRKLLTIDSTVVDADLYDFDVDVALTAATFSFAKSNSDGYDIRFTASDGRTWIPHTRLYKNGSTSALYRLKFPFISSSTDTLFYIYYRTTDTLDASRTMSSTSNSFPFATTVVGYWEMSTSTTSTTTVNDSSLNALNLTKLSAGNPAESTGKVWNAQTFSSDYLTRGDTGALDSTTEMSISAWVYTGSSTQDYQPLVMKRDRGGIAVGNYSMWLYYDGAHYEVIAQFGDTGGVTRSHETTIDLLHTNEWHYITCVFDWDSDKVYIYIDGVSRKDDAETNNVAADTTALNMGYYDATYKFAGALDEVYLVKDDLSLAWAKAEYNNGNGTLLKAFGAEETEPSAVWGKVGWDYRQRIEVQGSGSILGNVAITNGSAAVTGTGTTFTDWLVGDQILLPDGAWYTIDAIASDTSITLTDTYAGSTATLRLFDMRHVNYPVRFDLMTNKSIIPVNQQMVMKGATEADSVVLDVGAGLSWDNYGVGCVQMVPYDTDNFVMVYNGWNHKPVYGEPTNVGAAYSTSLSGGGSWTKIGGTGEVLTGPIGWENIFGNDVYKVGSTYYLMASVHQPDSLPFTDKDYTEQWVWSTTDFVTFTEIGWWNDIYDIDWSGLGLAMNPNGSILKNHEGEALQVGSYYYMIVDAIDTDGIDFGTQQLRATTLDSRMESWLTGDDSSASIYGTNWISQTFTTTAAYKATTVRLKVSQTGTTTDNINVSIQALSSGKPDGTKLISENFDASYLDGTDREISVRLHTGSSYNLANGTKYAIVVSYPTGDVGNHIHVRYDTSSGYAGGGAETSADSGSTWSSESATDDLMFLVHKSIWEYMGWVHNPDDHDGINDYIVDCSMGEEIIQWGDQYVLVHAGGFYAGAIDDNNAYFSYTDNIADEGSWTLCREPWADLTYKNESRYNFYDDGMTLHVWADWRIGTSGAPNYGYDKVRVIYFSNNINSIISFSSHAQTDFGDISWMDDDSNATQAHWTEESLDNAVNGWASQWVKLSYVASSFGSSFVHVYYANAGAANSEDPENVFTLYDHFTSLDAGTWTSTGDVAQAGTEISITQSAASDVIYSNDNFGYGYAFRNKWKRVDESATLWATYMSASSYRIVGVWAAVGIGSTFVATVTAGPVGVATEVHSRDDNVWHISEVTRDMLGYSNFYVDYYLERTISSALTGDAIFVMQNDSAIANEELDIDWAIIRKCLRTEPKVWAASATTEPYMSITVSPTTLTGNWAYKEGAGSATSVLRENTWYVLNTGGTADNFTLTNDGTVSVDVLISGTDWTGIGTTWHLSDSGSPGDHTIGIWAGLDDDNQYDIVVKKSQPYNFLLTALTTTTHDYFSLKFYTCTSNGGNAVMSGTITLTAVVHT